ncbi:MAG: hypothetical protein RL404_1550 [Pseudomonadota bacterium]|jgi:twitching motility protein PilI
MDNLMQAASGGSAASRLGFVAGGIRWLVDTAPGVQVIDAAIAHVPLTQPWYLGLVRHQQKLLGVVDLAGLCGRAVLPVKTPERMLVLPAPWHVALRVDRLYGRVDTQPLPDGQGTDKPPPTPFPEASGPVLGGEALVDAGGTRWHVLDVTRLCTSAAFLQAGIALSA